MDLSKLFNFNVYLGNNALIGKASEVTLPEVVAAVEDSVGAGQIGVLQIPTGKIDPLTARIKWNGYYGEAIALGADPFKHHKIQVRGNVEVHGPDGLAAEQPLIVLMTARFQGTPLGALVSQANTELEQNLTVSYCKVTLDNEELLEVDVHNSIWRVRGQDIRANYRRNLGL